MVTDAIFNWILDMVQWLMSQNHMAGMPVSLLDFTWFGDMNYFLPVTEMFGLFTAFFALGGPMIGVSLIVWIVVGVLRGGATKA
ncbi:hypothetical protein AB4Z38_25235 [Arthrobacter sp. 2RAF6]|uniref:hypothetical protein n=1 Tax=Arthrobacter sp. 2RAF6 TaxID=3233002 RepID=UPI003F8EBED1